MYTFKAVPNSDETSHQLLKAILPMQISIGQEETDDIISRDINRTFPEHPQFAFEQGQNALFRVLKAYSLHDLEVLHRVRTTASLCV